MVCIHQLSTCELCLNSTFDALIARTIDWVDNGYNTLARIHTHTCHSPHCLSIVSNSADQYLFRARNKSTVHETSSEQCSVLTRLTVTVCIEFITHNDDDITLLLLSLPPLPPPPLFVCLFLCVQIKSSKICARNAENVYLRYGKHMFRTSYLSLSVSCPWSIVYSPHILQAASSAMFHAQRILGMEYSNMQ